MTVSRVLFTKFIVADLPAAKTFYEQAFGFVVRNRITLPGMEEVLIGLADDTFTLVLYHHTDGRALTRGDHHGPLGLSTRDIDAAWDRAIAAGGTAVRPPEDLPGMRIAFLDDPEGHTIELIQYKRDKAREGATQ
ncbi:VOC family protein [Sphingomonas sp. CCH5-D11]|uniref:VOC family protein n=1 Tax=Sphingomonas sp. CCH5-D11 TaxID=1768786 RepID=UPI00082A65AC|nr:VOC family protein [Sphingomonas sp. CCH5-D11]